MLLSRLNKSKSLRIVNLIGLSAIFAGLIANRLDEADGLSLFFR